MRIAFVGKGGSGKTTLAALFTKLLEKENRGNTLSIDADINVHLPELLTGKPFPQEKFISLADSTKKIKEHLRGTNTTLQLETFRKTTPPTKESNLINIDDNENPIINEFSIENGNTKIMAVGTYNTDGIGASCYHNNLSILENILSHLNDANGTAVVDMVAGTDAFASSLHAQFDIIILVVEPTRRGLEVYKQYSELSTSAGIEESIYVVGNKINTQSDKNFLSNTIPEDKLIGFFSNSEYIREHDKVGGPLRIEELETSNNELLTTILDTLLREKKDPNERLQKIHSLHKKYVSQAYITERFGDLTKQIDASFTF